MVLANTGGSSPTDVIELVPVEVRRTGGKGEEVLCASMCVSPETRGPYTEPEEGADDSVEEDDGGTTEGDWATMTVNALAEEEYRAPNLGPAVY